MEKNVLSWVKFLAGTLLPDWAMIYQKHGRDSSGLLVLKLG
jgi:hypothetical protein